MTGARREILLFGGLAVLIGAVFMSLGAAYGVRMLAEASCYAILALGLTIQWGYAGLFNAGVMGFVALGGVATMTLTYPVNEEFWASDGPAGLAGVAVWLIGAVAVVWGVSRSDRLGVPKGLRNALTAIVAGAAYLVVVAQLEPVAEAIEKGPGFIGGFGMPVLVGWAAGGVVAGLVAWFVGHVCLGLRSDYLAIATLGIAEIIKAVLKNSDWWTRGTLTVSPLPWPVPTPGEIGFVAARSAYLAVTAVLIVVIYLLLQRAWHAPWGRMMRAIRDNEVSSAAMGKDVNRRRLEIFILGSVLMGIGGAALVSFSSIFDPSGFIPLNHTFLVWVMVILGGAGNNRGAIFGALLVYVVWTMSEPAALALFDVARAVGDGVFGAALAEDLNSRALQMRVFVIGLTITLVLRYAPRGMLPEEPPKHE
ncbi:MAG: branched-chain amino acid ABC transporter permease [Minwuia sp.]|uniref:branched-chain amino acid ABC transporter permease n=1 Tax=Minwuia sp. TaxID=2493630 RepID=UPI003A8BF1AB